VLVAAGVTAAVAVVLLFLWYARDVLLLAFAGVLLAVFLRRLATWVSDHTPLSPRWALVLVVLAITGGLVGAFWLRGPAIAAEVRTLREQLPQAAEQLQQRLERYEWGQRVVEEAPSPRELLPDDPDAIGRATGVVSRTFSTIASFAIILFLGIVIAATPGVYVRGVLALVPAQSVGRGRAVIGRLYDTLWWWLVGRVISMTFIGVATGVGLWLLGVPLAFPLGLLAALLSFIPNLGPILSAVPALLLAFVDGPQQALWVALLYGGVQVVESYVLDPIIDRKTVYLPPALTVLAQLVLAVFAGLLGVALATPLTAALVVLVTMLYVHDVLGRHDVGVPSH
jgi:predicted PurR-regulated permease PerM